MNLFIELHQQLLRKLLEYNVDFIVVGGYSVIYHGYPRTTGDIDIWLKPDNLNRSKLLPVLKFFDIDDEYIDYVSNFDFTTHLVFSIGEEPEKMDFLTRLNLVEYEDAEKQKLIADVDGIPVPFLHINDLVLSKINTGRLKDQADIQQLQQVKKAKK